MSAMSNFENLQAQQNERVGHHPASAQAAFNNNPTADGAVHDSFCDLMRCDGSPASLDFCRRYDGDRIVVGGKFAENDGQIIFG